MADINIHLFSICTAFLDRVTENLEPVPAWSLKKVQYILGRSPFYPRANTER